MTCAVLAQLSMVGQLHKILNACWLHKFWEDLTRICMCVAGITEGCIDCTADYICIDHDSMIVLQMCYCYRDWISIGCTPVCWLLEWWCIDRITECICMDCTTDYLHTLVFECWLHKQLHVYWWYPMYMCWVLIWWYLHWLVTDCMGINSIY